MERLKEWHQIYQEYRGQGTGVEMDDQETQGRHFSFSVTSSLPQLFSQQRVQLLLLYQKGLVKRPISNLAEVLPQESLLVYTRLKAQNLVILLRFLDDRAEEEVVVECRPTGNRGYKAALRTYLLTGELDQNLVENNASLVQFSWNEAQGVQGVTLEPDTLYSALDVDALSQTNRVISQATTVNIEEVKFTLNQVNQQHQQSGNYALLVRQHSGLATISQQIVPLQQAQGLTFNTSAFQLKMPQNVTLATFFYFIEQGNNSNVILGYLPYDCAMQNQQMNMIVQGKTILGEQIVSKFQGTVFVKNTSYQPQNIKINTAHSPMNNQMNTPNSQMNEVKNGLMTTPPATGHQNINNQMMSQIPNNHSSSTIINNQTPSQMNNFPLSLNGSNKDQELDFLRTRVMQLEQQTMNNQSSTQPGLEQSLQSREQTFVNHLSQIREDNKLLFSQKEEEFQKLKEVILELKEQNSTFQAQGGLAPKDPLMARVENIVQIHQSKQFAETKHQILDPQYGMRDLSRKDKAQFSQGPWGESLQQSQLENIDMDREYLDNKKQLVFTFQFMGLEKKLVELSGQQQKSIMNESYILPSKIYMSINFYDFAEFKTDSYSLNAQGLLSQESSSRQANSQYTFRVDASDQCVDQERVQLNYQQICDYLLHKSVNIDIWDSDSLLLFGNVQLRLQELLRQGENQRSMMKGVDIRDHLMCRIKGALKVAVSVRAEPCKQVNYASQSHQLQGPQAMLSGTSRRRKVKSQAPLQLPTRFEGDLYSTQHKPEQSETSRIQEKISAYKRHSAVSNLAGKGAGGEQIETREKRVRELELIGQYREEKKKNLVQEIQEQLVEEERRVEVQQGVQQLQTYKVLNGSQHETLYRITVTDPENQHLSQPEVSLVTNAMEWRHHLSTRRDLPPPPDFDLLTQDGAFILKPNESVTLLFKVLSFRNTSIVCKEQVSKEGQYMKERGVTVQLANREGQILGGVSLQLKCRNSIVEQVVRQYQGAEKYVDLCIYNPLLTSGNRVLHLTYPKASVKYQNPEEVAIEVKTNQVGQLLTFNLLIFSDVYYSRLLNNVQVQVSSVQQVDVNLTLGQESQVQLPIFSDLPRICRLFSSHLLCLHFPPPFHQQFNLTPASYTFINAKVKSFSEINEQVLVHCVDSSSKELVYAWLVNVSTSLPKVSAVIGLQLDPGQRQTKTFYYLNRLPQWSLFDIASSKPDVLQILDQQLGIDSGAKGMIKVAVTDLQEDTNVYIFINDKERSLFDTILINLQVSQPAM